jgi:glycine/D-amino acid oxidase-like deaminating enzyme
MATRTADVIVVGAGIVGAACAHALQAKGRSVALVDAAQPGGGVTAVGMGHLVALDESPDELALCLLSLRLWREFFDANPSVGDPLHCGTLWVAENEHHLHEARARGERLAAHGHDGEMIGGDRLAAIEPQLRGGLAGALLVRGDSVVYPPAVAFALAMQVGARGGQLYFGRRVAALDNKALLLDNGDRLEADAIVIATGAEMARLMPEVPVFGRKGHLAITDRYPGMLRHQVVSMAYGQTEAGSDALAVAANLQPRSTGQILLGSCRQDGQLDNRTDAVVTAKVLKSCIGLMPALGDMRVIRSWAGMRPATPDGRPLIGAHPGRPGVWLAGGHEGLGVTTAFGTADILARQLTGADAPFDCTPFAPARIAALENRQ